MKYMTAEETKAILGQAGYTIVDVRKAADHEAAHIPGAIGVDMDAAKEGDFQAGVAAMKTLAETSKDTLVLVCYSGKRYAQASTNVLSALGYDMDKVYTLEGGFTKWSEVYPEDVATADAIVAPATDVAMKYMTAEETKAVLGQAGYTIVDVRKAADHEAAHIPGAIGIDMDAAKEGDFQAGVAAMKPLAATSDDTLILVCYSGKRYAQASTNVLSALGYDMDKVYTLEGGFKQWSEVYPGTVEPKVIVAPASDVAMKYMSAADTKAVLGKEGYTIVDVRKAADYETAHVPGAVGVDMDAAKEGDFQAGVASMTPLAESTDDTLILVCYSGKRYAQASTNVLSALGYDMDKVYTLEGGFKQWSTDYPNDVEPKAVVEPASDVAMKYMSAADTKAILGKEGYTIIDVRKAADYQTSHIPGAIGVDMDAAKEGDFQAGVASMKPAIEGLDDTIVLICYSGKRYAQASTNVLSALGYDMSKVYTLEGGFKQWSADYPNDIEK